MTVTVAPKPRRSVEVANPNVVIMQPTTLCNLDCRYCYLPFRKSNLRMLEKVASSVAASVSEWTTTDSVEVCWHGGEPLSAGRQHLGQLMEKFAGLDVVHSIQTNATLIDQEWVEFLSERKVHVGVSIDGPSTDNSQRRDHGGAPSFDRAVRGIRRLVEAGQDVSVIAVVSDPTPSRARRLYEFVAGLGCRWLGVNIEEREGVNERPTAQQAGDVVGFWAAMIDAWRTSGGELEVREVDRVLSHIGSVIEKKRRGDSAVVVDPLPTVAWNGSVTLISPELAGFESPRLGDFACGNVLHTDLRTLINAGLRKEWVEEYFAGIDRCRTTCQYFDFCGGGHPANRYFELGRLDSTETDYCRNSKIYLMEGALRYADAIS